MSEISEELKRVQVSLHILKHFLYDNKIVRAFELTGEIFDTVQQLRDKLKLGEKIN